MVDILHFKGQDGKTSVCRDMANIFVFLGSTTLERKEVPREGPT